MSVFDFDLFSENIINKKKEGIERNKITKKLRIKKQVEAIKEVEEENDHTTALLNTPPHPYYDDTTETEAEEVESEKFIKILSPPYLMINDNKNKGKINYFKENDFELLPLLEFSHSDNEKKYIYKRNNNNESRELDREEEKKEEKDITVISSCTTSPEVGKRDQLYNSSKSSSRFYRMCPLLTNLKSKNYSSVTRFEDKKIKTKVIHIPPYVCNYICILLASIYICVCVGVWVRVSTYLHLHVLNIHHIYIYIYTHIEIQTSENKFI